MFDMSIPVTPRKAEFQHIRVSVSQHFFLTSSMKDINQKNTLIPLVQ